LLPQEYDVQVSAALRSFFELRYVIGAGVVTGAHTPGMHACSTIDLLRVIHAENSSHGCHFYLTIGVQSSALQFGLLGPLMVEIQGILRSSAIDSQKISYSAEVPFNFA